MSSYQKGSEKQDLNSNTIQLSNWKDMIYIEWARVHLFIGCLTNGDDASIF